MKFAVGKEYVLDARAGLDRQGWRMRVVAENEWGCAYIFTAGPNEGRFSACETADYPTWRPAPRVVERWIVEREPLKGGSCVTSSAEHAREIAKEYGGIVNGPFPCEAP